MKNHSLRWIRKFLGAMLGAVSILSFEFPFLSIDEAKAIVGRPLTPVSVAGVARRTVRRSAVATGAVVAGTAMVGAASVAATAATVGAVRLATLPSGCVTSVVNGISYSQCGGIYYQPMYEGANLVYVQVQPPA